MLGGTVKASHRPSIVANSARRTRVD
jgi:hypothetical protein